MTDRPVDLDACRSLDNQIAVAFRRHASGACGADHLAIAPVRAALHAQMLAGPADSWPDTTQKAVFLIERYARTAESRGSQIQILIRRALCDIARLTRREERMP